MKITETTPPPKARKFVIEVDGEELRALCALIRNYEDGATFGTPSALGAAGVVRAYGINVSDMRAKWDTLLCRRA